MKRFFANLYWLIAIFLHTQKVIPMNLTTDQLTALQTKTSALIDAAQAQATTDLNLVKASMDLAAAQAPTRPRSTPPSPRTRTCKPSSTASSSPRAVLDHASRQA